MSNIKLKFGHSRGEIFFTLYITGIRIHSTYLLDYYFNKEREIIISYNHNNFLTISFSFNELDNWYTQKERACRKRLP